MRDLISGEAELGSDEEDDQSFDEETGETRPRKEQSRVEMDDSSEEEEDDDDAEAARAVCSLRARGTPVAMTNRLYRSAKVSSSTTRRMRSPRNENAGGGSVDAQSARRKRPSWMKRIST
jgi:hypothetical protein